ncbi:MAG: hypothetical protein WCD89_03625 [Anaerocolumna sp.]
MLSKSFRLIWIKLQVQNNIHFNFPIPLYIFQELLNCFLDFMILACFFVPKPVKSVSTPSFSINTVKELVQMILETFDSLTGCEPYDLVEVTTDHVKVCIKIS